MIRPEPERAAVHNRCLRQPIVNSPYCALRYQENAITQIQNAKKLQVRFHYVRTGQVFPCGGVQLRSCYGRFRKSAKICTGALRFSLGLTADTRRVLRGFSRTYKHMSNNNTRSLPRESVVSTKPMIPKSRFHRFMKKKLIKTSPSKWSNKI